MLKFLELEITHLINNIPLMIPYEYEGFWVDVGTPEQYAKVILNGDKSE